MFFHIFKYKVKQLLKTKEGIFWTLLFPIILSTLFYVTFGTLDATETFDKIDVAVISSTIENDKLMSAMNESEMFNITETTEENAKELLKDGDITAYIYENNGIKMAVQSTGLNQSIANNFLNGFSQINNTITTIYHINPQGVTEEFMGSLSEQESYITDVPVSESNSPWTINFYALIAMTCLFAATFGVYDVIEIQANQSALAARKGISPTHKLKVFLSSISATILFQFISILLVLAYITQVLNIDFGNSMVAVMLFCLVSIITGVTMGTAISSVLKAKENTKAGIVVSIVMLSTFFAGLQSPDLKYLVEKNFPLISYINPGNVITNGFLSLYYYNSYHQYFLNMAILLVMSVIFSTITYLVLRRQKYASI